jgi:beta-lactamase class A
MTAKMGGFAHIDSQPVGTTFTVGELMEYAIRYSDNTAYYMLNQRFAFSGFTEYANALGITANRKNNLTLTLPKPRFGYLSARDVGLYCEDIAHYIDEGSDNAKQLFSWMITTVDQQQLPDAYAGKTYTIEDLKDKEKLNAAYESRREGYTIAHKYGEQNTQAYHDGAIVWRDHPYVLAILTTLPPYEEDSIHVFHDIASLVDQIQTDWYR